MPKRKTEGGVYYTDFYAPSGGRVRKSTGTRDRRQAQEFEDRLKAQYWRADKLGEAPKRVFEEAALRWLDETQHKRSHETDKKRLKKLYLYFQGVRLDRITRAAADEFARQQLAAGLKASTVNRYLALLRAILNKAYQDWGWLDEAPSIRMLREPKHRINWATRDQAETLLAELPGHLEAMARFTLATGLREANVVGLRWAQVDLERRVAWVHADEAKAGRALSVPLNSEAVVVLRQQQGKHPEYVFTYRGQPVTRAHNHAWRKACRRAGLPDFRWHDLRHTWASWHVQAGTPLEALRELGGWSSLQMVLRYAHLAPGHLAEHQDRLAGPRLVTDTDTPGTTGTDEEAITG